MYRIIGGDRKEYGPVSAEQLRRWLSEGRLNLQSMARAEDGGEWKPLAAFPELAEGLGVPAGSPAAGGVALPPLDSTTWSAEILARESQLRVGRCLSRSWGLLFNNFGLLVGATLVVWLVSLTEFIPLIGGVAYQVLWGALYGGFYLIFLKRIRGQTAALPEVFDGFKLAFGQLALAGFISSLLAGIGFLFCLVPGLYLMVAWLFCVPLVADRRLEFWPAMELSRKVVTRAWFPVFGLALLAFLPMVAVSIFGTVKITVIALTAAKHAMSSGHLDVQRLMDEMTDIPRLSLLVGGVSRVVLLLNLPFAAGALMYAYEDLFGARKAAAA